jgi:hypothetical protein
MKFTILIILAVILNLVASSLRRSHRRILAKDQLQIIKDACKSTCKSLTGYLSFTSLKSHLFVNAPENKAGCMCLDNETPKYTHHWDKASQKFLRDTEHDGNLVAYYQRLKRQTVEHILR